MEHFKSALKNLPILNYLYDIMNLYSASSS